MSCSEPSSSSRCVQPPQEQPSEAEVSKLETAIEEFNVGAHGFQSVLSNLILGVEAEREDLRKAREQLLKEREAFENETRRVQQVYSNSDQITLNVGGHKFTTTVATLQLAPPPSLFSAMFSGRHVLKPDETGCYFIDRDGRHFHDILNFLRDGQFSYPVEGADYKYLMELRAEAEFYGLIGLVEQIDRYPYSLTRVHRASTMNLQDSWMYEDGQDEIVFKVDRPCQILGVGLCGTDGAYTVELELVEVDPLDFSIEICRIAEGAQSFTRSDMNDQQIVRMMLDSPAALTADKHYMLSALIKGTESFCCEECLDVVIGGGIRVTFLAWESPNGTTQERGQFPELYIRPL
uniref:K+ channel tetramerization subfamily protein n=1 Tax=Tetraselmis sp. GSL018 TaxID=582737 RepID=A0A061R7F2_9CHLO|mmetsp:Transcript_29149/g.69611  ORF Transcript_29149/g.69611 Transcript_29149/m.69611 type:complete len:349 (-) Transcript_29149:324-1370(-)